MIIAGANRHAKEILEILHQKKQLSDLFFFDDVSNNPSDVFLGKFPVLHSLSEAKRVFENYPLFILGLGNPLNRHILAKKLTGQNGQLTSIIAESAHIGHYDVILEAGLNIMINAMISNSVFIGEGTLVNAYVSIHHDVTVGKYCEISPHATLLGGCSLGQYCSVGSNATILPDVKIGKNVSIGAGSVVSKDLPDNAVAVGVPAKIIRFNFLADIS